MKNIYLIVVLLLSYVLPTMAQAKKPESGDWHDSTRDVFVDNELDRQAQVLVADNPTRLALISTRLDRAIVLNIAEKTMSATAKDAFHFAADRTAATTDAGIEMQSTGKFTRIDGPVYSFAVGGMPVLIRAHPGAVGELTLEKLWETVPVWHAKADAYVPDAASVAALKSVDKDIKLTLVFGTWCPDSKHYVPELLRALRDAGNSRLQVKLIGIDSQFHEPVDTVQPRQITNVPTVIVERNGTEIGRIVETPAVDSMERDLADLLNGKPNTHPGRLDRGAKVASGVYQYTDSSGKPMGSETWEMFNTAEGGYLLHSRIATRDGLTEVFDRVNAQSVPTFVEITRQRAGDRDRTRISIDGHTLAARMRGSITGIVQQTLELPEFFSVMTPARAAEGLALASMNGSTGRTLACYRTASEFAGVMGEIGQVTVEAQGEQSVRVPAGEFHARHFSLKSETGLTELWLHPQLNVPVRGRVDGREFMLMSIEVAPLKK